MRTIIFLSILCALPALPQVPTQETSVAVSGMVSLADGTTAPSGLVSFYRIDPPPAPNAPQFVQHAPVRPYGSYAVHLPPGTYRVCTQLWDVPGLNPCLWSKQPTELTVQDNTPSVNFPLVLETGRFVRLKVDDSSKRLFLSHPAKRHSDLRLGVMTHSGFVDSAAVESSDTDAIVYRAVLPVDEAPPILMHHHKVALVDSNGTAISDSEWSDISAYAPSLTHGKSKAALPKINKKSPDITLAITDVVQ